MLVKGYVTLELTPPFHHSSLLACNCSLRKLGDVDYEAKANAREKDHGLEDGLF